MIQVERWTGPPVDTHAYLVYDPDAAEGWAIDAPLQTAAPVMERAAELGLRLARVLLTHGHFDHVLDVERYEQAGLETHHFTTIDLRKRHER